MLLNWLNNNWPYRKWILYFIRKSFEDCVMHCLATLFIFSLCCPWDSTFKFFVRSSLNEFIKLFQLSSRCLTIILAIFLLIGFFPSAISLDSLFKRYLNAILLKIKNSSIVFAIYYTIFTMAIPKLKKWLHWCSKAIRIFFLQTNILTQRRQVIESCINWVMETNYRVWR